MTDPREIEIVESGTVDVSVSSRLWRVTVEHVLGMLAVGDAIDALLGGYPWLERDDILACIAYHARINSCAL